MSTQKGTDGTGDVVVANKLGVAAVPYVNGKAVTSGGKTVVIGNGDAPTLGFGSGSFTLTLVPKCELLGLNTALLGKDHQAATVKVTDPPVSDPGSDPGTNPGTNPGGTNPGGTNPGGSVPGEPNAGDRPITPRDPVARGAVPPAGDEDGRVGPDDGDTAAAPPVSDDSNNADDEAMANPVVKSNNSRGPGTTTLALIAAVCLLGVGVAALRTIVMGRTMRVSV
ncbi:MAG: hypothetical protein ACRDT4_14825 [Micromonosporaceae bacterium]